MRGITDEPIAVGITPKKREQKEESKVDSPVAKKSKWTSEERAQFIELLREHGKNFSKLKKTMNISLAQVKTFAKLISSDEDPELEDIKAILDGPTIK